MSLTVTTTAEVAPLQAVFAERKPERLARRLLNWLDRYAVVPGAPLPSTRFKVEELVGIIRQPGGHSLLETIVLRMSENARVLRENAGLVERIGTLRASIDPLEEEMRQGLAASEGSARHESEAHHAEVASRLADLAAMHRATESELAARATQSQERRLAGLADLERQQTEVTGATTQLQSELQARVTAREATESQFHQRRDAADQALQRRLARMGREADAAHQEYRQQMQIAQGQVRTAQQETATLTAAQAQRASEISDLERQVAATAGQAAALPTRHVSPSDGSGLPSLNGQVCTVS